MKNREEQEKKENTRKRRVLREVFLALAELEDDTELVEYKTRTEQRGKQHITKRAHHTGHQPTF